jgi:Zn-dependent protease
MSADLFYYLLSLVIVITIHEFSHAFVANLLGDPTAKMAGRTTLNPLAHLDPLGTIMLFVAHIGWGKPVPVNPHYFVHPKRDSALTALAGPLSNLLLAIFLVIPLKYFSAYLFPQVEQFLSTLWHVSVLLFAFNMLPFPPLDGSKFIGLFVPKRFQRAYDRYLEKGMIYFVLFVLFDQFILHPLAGKSILQTFIDSVTVFLKAIIFWGS